MIKHNKSLQNILNISINNYKLFAGKYIIFESNRIGKEYDACNDSLIFKGEYLNGKRNGKGKVYCNNRKLLFEGEYLNGERNGKGKEYNWNDDLEFEGEYLNWVRNGKGKKYNYSGQLEFEDEYFDNMEWIGTRYDQDGNIMYKVSNNINGEVKEYDDDGKLRFEGEYKNGIRNGKGIE